MNGPTHKTIGALSSIAGLAIINDTPEKQSIAHNPFVVSVLGVIGSTLPDKLEPASIGPHHRQFFHSFAMLGTVGYGVYKAYKWEPETELGKCLRVVAMMLGVGYASHLIADSTTPKGLPVI